MKLLKELYYIQSGSGNEDQMREFLISKLDEMGIDHKIDNYGNLYVIKGKGNCGHYPCLAAHMDEISFYRDGFEVIEDNGWLFSRDSDKRCNLGADDKNGLWVILNCMADDSIPNLKAFMSVEEEMGLIGAAHAEMSFFDDCDYVLGVDRPRYDEVVTSIHGVELCSQEFVDALPMEQFGYHTSNGASNDVKQLKMNGLPVSIVNISCAYFDHHTHAERTNIAGLQNCLAFVKQILTTLDRRYPHAYSPRP